MTRSRQSSTLRALETAPVLAKLSAPRLRKVVQRRHVFRFLDQVDAPIVWLHAPPGSGKTTMAASYFEERRWHSIWYQLDNNDRDLAQLFANLSVAASTSATRLAALPVFDPAQRSSWRAFARQFARAFFATLPADSVLMFDNAQEASGSDFEQLLEIFWEELPPDRRIWVSSHLAPPAAFSVQCAKGKGQTIHSEQFSFSSDEARDLIRQLAPSQANSLSSDVEQLISRSRGWAAGMVLVAAHHEHRIDAPISKEPTQIFDYFARAVFCRLTPVSREALVKLSVPPWFTSAIAERLAGPAAFALIDELLRRALFLERREVDGVGTVFQLQPLFRDYLSKELEGQMDSVAIMDLKLTSGRLMEDLGQNELATKLYLAAANELRASTLLCNVAPFWLRGAHHALLVELTSACLRSVARLPPEISAWLYFWRGLATAANEEVSARADFEHSFDHFERIGNQVGMIVSAGAVVQALTESWRSFADVERWATLLDTHYSERISFPSPELELVAVSGLLSATITTMSSKFEDHALARLMHLVESDADCNSRLVACLLALPRLQMTGKLELAATLINCAQRIAKERGITEYRRASWLQMRAMFHFLAYSIHSKDRSELAQGERALREAIEIATRFQFEGILFRAEWLDAENALMRGEYALCESKIAAAERWLSPTRPANLLSFHLLRAHLAALKENFPVALQEIEAAVSAGRAAGFPSRMMRPYRWSEAQIRVGLGDFNGAREAGQFALSHAQGAYRELHITGLLIFDALEAINSIDPRSTAERGTLLRPALHTILENVRLHRFFSICGLIPKAMARLCAESLHLGLDRETVATMIRKRKYRAPDPTQEEWPFQVRVRVLGDFVLELDGIPFAPSGKSQKKPLELLQALAASGARAFSGVRVDSIIASLWPSIDTDDPKGSFDTSLHRLRKLLNCPDAIQLTNGTLRLNRDLVWCDVDAFENLLCVDYSQHQAGISQLAQRIGNLYRGNLVPCDADWAIQPRERLRARFIESVLKIGMQLELAGMEGQALDLYEQGLVQDDLVEAFYCAKMRILVRQGRKSDALRTYRRCKELLSVVFGIAPNEETELLRSQIG